MRNHLQVRDCTQGEIDQNNEAPGPGNLYELAADLSLSFIKEIYGEVREVRSEVEIKSELINFVAHWSDLPTDCS